MMIPIVTVVIVAYMVLLALFTALPARKRHWSMTVVRIVITLASAVAAVPFSKLVAGELSGRMFSLVETRLPADLRAFMGEVSLAAESVQLIVTLFIAPLMFLLIFTVLRWVLNLIVWIIERIVPALRKKSKKNTAKAMPLGAVHGLIIALVTLIPLCGYVLLATTAIDALDGMTALESTPAVQDQMKSEGLVFDQLSSETPSFTDDPTVQTVMNIASTVEDDPVIGFMNDLGGPLFGWMTSGTLNDNGRTIKFTLSEELPHLTESATELIDAMALLEDNEISAQDKEAVIHAFDTLLSSDWVAELTADSLGYVAGIWLEGKPFMGKTLPDMGPMLQPVMDVALQVLSTEDAESLRADVRTVTGVVTDLMAAGFLAENADYEALLANLGESGLLNNLMTTLNANPHMAPLVTELKSMSVRVVSSVLGETLKNTEEYDPMIDQLSNELTNVLDKTPEERKEIISETVKNAFDDHGVSVPEDVAVELSEKAIEDLGADGEITSDELKQYLIDHVGDGMDIAGDIVDENGDIIEDLPDFGV